MSTTLGNIKAKIRSVTGRKSINQLSDTELTNYINNFLQYELPQQIRLFPLRTLYRIILQPNLGFYSVLPTDINLYSSFESPCYVDGFELQYFQDENAFLQKFSQLKFTAQLATGNGLAGPYNGTYSYTPIQPTTSIISTLDAAGNSLTCQATLGGVLYGDVLPGGTINYTTGVVTNLIWNAPIPNGTPIYISALRYVTGRPIAVLYFSNMFYFWPWPNRAYDFEIVAYKNPAALLVDSELPEVNQWWEMIAYGAALKIFADNLDMDSYGKTRVLFDEQRRLVERTTLKQLSTQRAATIYGDAQNWPWQGGYPYN